ncbi:C40 family peptidase [Treponema primitia]|uniref:C40 family peptidase n=1 Tax=Treponema primitia TaxID=88058 RepID=UPI0002554DFD|nr:C40 family peptidase [Treponema primitia]
MGRRIVFLYALYLLIIPALHPDEETERNLAAFSDPARVWGSGVEGVIEEAYRQCFKTYILDGKVMNLRMPFAQNNERDQLSEQSWEFLGGGKADPAYLWQNITETLDSDDFQSYTETLGDGREKVMILDIPTQTWTHSRDLFDIARMKAGAYRGLPHRPYVLVSGGGISETDVYNYLYCIGWTGMDCSGFVWHTLSLVAKKGGIDLGRTLRRAIGARGGDVSYYVGTWFFNSRSREIISVKDEIRNIQPADVLLFRGSNGGMVHSAVIQSVDLREGVVRYLQSTDEAPLAERGVHESLIYFNPAHPETSLSDPSLVWTQSRYPPFPGEQASAFSDDGERYRAFGGGRVVRLRALAGAIQKINRR